MIAPHAFVFIKHEDQVSLGRAILRINASRRQRLVYRSLILSAPRRGWITLLLGGGGMTDHLLLRNLSGRLSTLAFELHLGMIAFSYRLYREGRTVSAFESNLPFYVNNRLQMLRTPRDINILDLAEPVERLVLERFHANQHPGRVLGMNIEIPEDIEAYYRGNPARLQPVLRPGVDEDYVASLLAPGFNPEGAFELLVSLLDLPYLPADTVEVGEGDAVRRITGYAITRPSTWRETLPDGWRRMPALLTGAE